ncbi:metal-dependent phosphohydrolase [Oceanicoccus sagamiensis]|uniref:Metal-dependent phosphohydrolase n=1 Tax=Oceanicoccus sagamiensis TaxID=716816 RepID=A0A1X9NP46_9GAMM|nr:metal-dependent phosphohydrolase [Oceanicoccus sagamiensis]
MQENVKTPMPVSGLKVGMYVCELDRPWLETPFILQGFKITSIEEIDTIAEHCEFVYIEGSEDAWLDAEERSAATTPKAKVKTYTNSATNKQEFSKASSIHETARGLTRSFMDDVRLGQGINIQEVKASVSDCVSSILRNPDAMMWMSKIRKKDEYTSEHSLNVGLLAITFGRHLGASEEDLNKLGLAGMLHDVGKMRTPNDILNKEGQLSAEEFNVIKDHAVHGRDILMAHKNVYHGAVDVAYSHHEALDGTGYPRKIKASGITDFTRIITLCDVYDAITSDRIYKQGRSSLDALKIMYQNKGTKFDHKLVGEFISCIGLYPPGSIVELKNGQVGIVISTNYRHRHLPKVLLLRDENKMPKPESVLDLERYAKSQDQSVMIKTVIPNGSHGIRIESYIQKGLTID